MLRCKANTGFVNLANIMEGAKRAKQWPRQGLYPLDGAKRFWVLFVLTLLVLSHEHSASGRPVLLFEFATKYPD